VQAPEQVAQRPRPRPSNTGPAPAEGPVPTGGPAAGDPAEGGPAEAAGAEVGAGRPLAGREPFVAFTDLGFSLRTEAGLPFLLVHFGSAAAPEAIDPAAGPEAAGPELAETQPAETMGPDPDRAVRETTVGAEDLVVLPEMKSPLRLATPEDLAMMWLGTTVPMDAIGEPDKLLTPNVGPVRVILYSGELFDGRLYAVGEQKVWLEMPVGRTAIVSHQIERIEHIEPGLGNPGLGQKGSQGYAGLEKVRVRTPGGVFYGKLLNREGDVVTLLTAEGARITLHDARVEPAGLSRSRVVDASVSELGVPTEKPAGDGTPR
jgi:hypothetical protein